MDYANMTTTEVTKLDGIGDLRLKPRMYFAKALIAEAKGDASEAAVILERALKESD